ncbi:PHP domain-containing protein [Salinibacterium sp. SWN248]|uniref:PHP domain-containing protein n=1 Tax=Salinibacterium sp. SWN248 TaxID=2792056 RepID=UPI0018CD252A|nr:PHP domain-containing protein [Salinibacterium sp. SWN248]MBH0022663.1 PHP domain-containing protein [Salinibacterium sp. SWN248]
MMIDLHTHSAVSDGLDSPAELMRLGAEAGLSVIGLTDHDTTAGWAEASVAAQQQGIRLLRGAELSTTDARGGTVHMLAYLFDPNAPELLAELAKAPQQREDRVRAIIERLQQDFAVSFESITERAGVGTMLGKPHIAAELVAIGAVPTPRDAFTNILADGSKYLVPLIRMSPLTAVDLVQKAGGVTVIAHPRDGERGNGLTAAEIAELRDAELFGLEVDHREHTALARAELTALATDLGLRMTGSSDYHATNKPNRLGENTTERRVLDELLASATSGMGLV